MAPHFIVKRPVPSIVQSNGVGTGCKYNNRGNPCVWLHHTHHWGGGLLWNKNGSGSGRKHSLMLYNISLCFFIILLVLFTYSFITGLKEKCFSFQKWVRCRAFCSFLEYSNVLPPPPQYVSANSWWALKILKLRDIFSWFGIACLCIATFYFLDVHPPKY